MTEKQKHLQVKQKKVTKQLQTTRHGCSDASTWIGNYEEEVQRFENEIVSLQQEHNVETQQLEEIRSNLKGKVQGFSDQIEIRQNDLEPWIERINAKKGQVAVWTSEKEFLLEKSTSYERARAEALKAVDALEIQKANLVN